MSDQLLDEILDAHPDWSVEEVGNEAARRLRERRRKQQQRAVGVAIAVVLLLSGAIAAVLLWQRGGAETMEPIATPSGEEELGTLSAVRFGPQAPPSVAIGQSVTLPLIVEGDGALEQLEVIVDPPAAGQAQIERVSGAPGVTFVAGAQPGEAQVVVRSRSDAAVATEPLTLSIVGTPALSVAVAPDSATTARPEVPFAVNFIVTNNGRDAAHNVQLLVDTPANLTVTEDERFIQQRCEMANSGVSCPLGQLFAPNGEGMIILRYTAAEPASFTFAADSYRLTYDGGGPVGGSAAHVVTVEGPTATRVALEPGQVDLPADGATTFVFRPTVLNQWGDPFEGPVRLQAALLGPDGAAPPTVVAPTPVTPVACRTVQPTRIREGQDVNSPELGELIAAEVALEARAFVPASGRLYVAVGDGSERVGWVSMEFDGQTYVECADAGHTELPPEPPAAPVVPPLGTITPAEPITWTAGTPFTYQAGSSPGEAVLVIQMVGEAGDPLGEPVQATIRLLELSGVSAIAPHLYGDATSAATDAPASIVLFRIPPSVPLELYPPEGEPPGTRRAGVRLWVPAAVIGDPQATALVVPMPPGQRVYFGSGLQDTLNSQQTADQTLATAASGFPVQLLGEAVNGYYPARLVGWIRVENEAAPGG